MTTDRARAFVRSLERFPRTIRLTHAILRGALAFAVVNEWLASNPVARVRPLRVEGGDEDALTPAEVGQLIGAAQEVSPAMGMTFLLGALTGARRGELVWRMRVQGNLEGPELGMDDS